MAQPTEGAQAVVDGDEDDGRLLDKVAALVDGVSAGRKSGGVEWVRKVEVVKWQGA